jgi:hypothetical protein
VNNLSISANHGMIVVPTETEGDMYLRIGWEYFTDDDLLRDCEQGIVTIV